MINIQYSGISKDLSVHGNYSDNAY